MIEALNFSLAVFIYKMAFAACIRIDELDDFLFMSKLYLILMFGYETILHITQDIAYIYLSSILAQNGTSHMYLNKIVNHAIYHIQ